MLDLLAMLAGGVIVLYILLMIASIGLFAYAIHLGMKNFNK